MEPFFGCYQQFKMTKQLNWLAKTLIKESEREREKIEKNIQTQPIFDVCALIKTAPVTVSVFCFPFFLSSLVFLTFLILSFFFSFCFYRKSRVFFGWLSLMYTCQVGDPDIELLNRWGYFRLYLESNMHSIRFCLCQEVKMSN